MNIPKKQPIQLYKKIAYQAFDKRKSAYWIYFFIREIKHRFFKDISVESTNDEEDSPYPKFTHEEQVQSETKKIKINSTAAKKI
jgi:hypothetical protein